MVNATMAQAPRGGMNRMSRRVMNLAHFVTQHARRHGPAEALDGRSGAVGARAGVVDLAAVDQSALAVEDEGVRRAGGGD